ncbi:MAG: 2-C-methyl-D-erythritol 4-phosphate cytidylyltransferase, partial [Pseudonocardia sp.]|nr:2-C-methyl-D-erythritol 4-phosphate cytidylyltransferase [Pseudonocardia sp.]
MSPPRRSPIVRRIARPRWVDRRVGADLTAAPSHAALSPVRSAAAIVLAGGSGSRLGAAQNKVYLPLGERTVLGWSLQAFAAHPAIGTVVLVARAEEVGEAEREAEALRVPVEIVEGGATRQDSEWCGLRRLSEPIAAGAVDVVLIHDGARPLVSQELITSVLAAARVDGGAVP